MEFSEATDARGLGKSVLPNCARFYLCAKPRKKHKTVIVPDSYIEDATPLVAQRLQMAGVRLAMVLNQAFK